MAFPSTFADLQSAVLATARMDPNKSSDVQAVKDAINSVYYEAVVECEALEASSSLTLTPGTGTYDLTSVSSGAIMRIKAATVTYSGVVTPPLRQVSLDWILRHRASTGGTATQQGPVQAYALVGYKDLELYPTPGSADTLTFYYMAAPTALSNGTDVPIIPEPYATNLLTYGALADVGVGDFKGDPRTAAWSSQFEYWMSKYRAHLQMKRGGQPGQFEFTPDRVYPPHDPSTIAAWNG